jgi:hypothetical protein
MKKIAAVVTTTIALASVAGQARAASPEQRIAALERQVALLARGPAATPDERKIAALQRRATALEKRVKKLEKSLNDVSQGVFAIALLTVLEAAYSECLTASTADAFAGTWNVVDQIAQATQAGKVYFGPQAAVSDFDSCTSLKVTRLQTVPPSVSPFSALTALLGDLDEE